MPNVFSSPVAAPQPEEPTYSVEVLELFPRLNRGTYLQKYGEQAPPWDKLKPIKRWFDTSVKEANAGYIYFDRTKKEFSAMYMTREEAAAINLPGTFDYLPYVVTPTTAVFTSMGVRVPVRADILSTKEQAQALVQEIREDLGLGNFALTVQESDSFAGQSIEWNGETRRPYVITGPNGNGDSPQSVGLLIARKYVNGVNSPGSWKESGGFFAWAPDAPGDTGEQDVRPEVPIPVRNLRNNEEIASYPFGIFVNRTDLAKPAVVNNSAGDSFSANDRETLNAIHKGVKALLLNAAQ